MANLNLGQDVANKSEKKSNVAAHIVSSFYPQEQAVWMLRYGSLININPSARGELRVRALAMLAEYPMIRIAFFTTVSVFSNSFQPCSSFEVKLLL